MIRRTEERARDSNRPYQTLLAILLAASVAGCAAMDGVNVGANLPIGGIVDVGVSKTIGDGRAPAQRQTKPPRAPDESADEEE